MSKKKWFGLLFVIAIIAVAYQLYRGTSQKVKTVLPAQTVKQVIAEARVVPKQRAMLSLPVGGVASEIFVSEGQSVKKGQLLVRLAASEHAAAALRQAQAELKHSQALLGDLKETAETEALVAVQELQKSESGMMIAAGEVKRAESLLKEGIITQQKFDEVFDRSKAARVDLEVKRTRYKIAEAHQRVAEEQYRILMAHERPRPVTSEYHAENIAVVVEAIRMSDASLQKAQLELSDTELRAPFDCVVGEVIPRVNEFVNAGSTILTVADLSQWQIETTDLTELSVVKLKQNDIAKISFDALPDLQMTGRITRIQPMGENKHGDILYTVVIQPDRIDPRFQWNMTAVVTVD